MKKLLIALGVLVGLPLVVIAGAWVWVLLAPAPAVEVAPDTTVFEGPLREDGTVDYAAAINAKFSEGVTPENNAFAALARLIMPSRWEYEPQSRLAMFDRLGVDMPSPDRAYFQRMRFYAELRAEEDDAADWAEQVPAVSGDELAEYEQLGYDPPTEPRWEVERDEALEGPWSAEQLPLVAEWLGAQDEFLDGAVAASQRDRYWIPLVPDPPDALLRDVLLPHLSEIRQMTQGLQVRALHRLHAGDVEGAIEDVFAIRRLGDHMTHSSILIEHLVGFALAEQASQVVAAIAAHEQLTADQARQTQAAWSAMARQGAVVDAIDIGERAMVLDLLQRPERLDDSPSAAAQDNLPAATAVGGRLDINQAMRRANTVYDDLVERASADTRAERVHAMAEVERRFDRIEQAFDAGEHHPARPSAWVRSPFSHRQVVTDALTDRWIAEHARRVGQAGMLSDRAEMHETLAQVALAVAGYRAEHGEHPPSLDALVPDWLDAVPTDIFDVDGGRIRYRVEDHRVVIYSRGENGEDNGGTRADADDEGDLVFEWRR